MTNPRLETFRAMAARSPRNPLAHFGLANEALKAGLWAEAEEHLRTYLELQEDEGNAYGRLAEALVQLGRRAEAVEVLRRGVEMAEQHGHPSMAAEFGERMAELRGA